MKLSIKTLLFALAICFTSTALSAQSTVKFRIKNAGFTTYGSFSGFSLDVNYDEAIPRRSKFNGTVKVTTVDTKNSARDKHLRKDDFFDVAKYPEMKFSSTAVSKVSSTKLKVAGKLTIKNVTKDVVFDVKVGKKGTKTTFSSTLKINRLDYKVGTSSWVLANDLYIDLYVEK